MQTIYIRLSDAGSTTARLDAETAVRVHSSDQKTRENLPDDLKLEKEEQKKVIFLLGYINLCSSENSQRLAVQFYYNTLFRCYFCYILRSKNIDFSFSFFHI